MHVRPRSATIRPMHCDLLRRHMSQLTPRPSLRPATSLVAVLALAGGTACAATTKASPWRADFASVRGVRPGMTVAEVARRWHVRFSFSTGSAPGCKIGGFRSAGVAGGALFQGGKFDAAWFDRGVTTPGGVHVGSSVSELRRTYGDRLQQEPNLYDAKSAFQKG